jgi:hypothetical protein
MPGKGRGLMRVQAEAPTVLVIKSGAETLARLPVEPGPWSELAFDVPHAIAEVEVASEGAAFTSFHYWFAAGAP